MNVYIVYNGTTLTWTITDLTSPAHPSATNSVAVNLPQDFGSNTAFVGFTGGSGGKTAIQKILDWTFWNP
jgi:hypothetical protein